MIDRKSFLYSLQLFFLGLSFASIFILLKNKLISSSQNNDIHVVRHNEPLHEIHSINKSSDYIQAYFSPEDNIQEIIIGYIKKEQRTIKCASFRMTDKAIILELLQAKKRGVKITFIVDQGGIVGMHNKILYLFQEGIPVYVFPKIDAHALAPKNSNKASSVALMHNKFFVFESQKIVITGSYNCTEAAHKWNQENIVVIQKSSIFSAYANHFDILIAKASKLASS